MHQRLSKSMLFGLVPLLASLVACHDTRESTSHSDSATPKAKPEASVRQPTNATITTISHANDQTLAELPVGAALGLELGTFFRVYDASNTTLLKGMLQITELLGNNRSIARQIALGDRQNPLVPGDRVREVLDLTKFIDPQVIGQTAQPTATTAEQKREHKNADQTDLHEQYQIELAKAKADFERQLAEIRKQYEKQLSATDSTNALLFMQREQELRADLTALKATFNEQVAKAISAYKQENETKLIDVTQEKEKARYEQQLAEIRKQYENQLAAADTTNGFIREKDKARYEQEMKEVRTQYENQLTAADATYAFLSMKREQTKDDDLAALKATFDEQMAKFTASIQQDNQAKLAHSTHDHVPLNQQNNSVFAQPTPNQGKTSTVAHHAAATAITNISQVNDQTLAELSVGTSDGLELGTFFRVYDASDSSSLKGMLQITELIGNNRSIARQIAIGDSQKPLVPGDQAREVLDLAKLIDPQILEQAARQAAAAMDQKFEIENASHTILRQQYQTELTKAQTRYDQQLADIRKQYEGQLTAADTTNALALTRREQELRADLAALKTTFSEKVTEAITTYRRESDAKLAATVQENANLSKQIESLLAQQQDLNERNVALVSEMSERDRANTTKLRTEIEARELLTIQLSELESRIAGKPTTTTSTILSADPKQGESVLDRLTRLSAALVASEEHNKGLESALATTRQSLARTTEAQHALQAKIDALSEVNTTATSLQKELENTQAKLKQVEQQRAELELARLNAERQLFDLAARVLRLAGSSPETMALQARLRDVLSTDAGMERSK